MDKDLRKIFKALERQGFEVFRLKSGHYGVTKDGEWVTSFGGTISDHRGMKNSIARAKRFGFEWPPS